MTVELSLKGTVLATMKYHNPNIAARVEQWLKQGGELNLADGDVNADELAQLASDGSVARSVRTLRLTGNIDDEWLPAMPLLGRFQELHGVQLNGCGLGDVADVADLFADGRAA